jgi:hypothetical protein
MIERRQRAGPHDEDQDVAYQKGRRRSPKHKGQSDMDCPEVEKD